MIDKARPDDMLIGMSHFFRDREAVDPLARDTIPELFKEPQRRLRAIESSPYPTASRSSPVRSST
ncbi:chemotaxis methyl-accepting protein methylase [Massilia sp. UYP11]|uniref:hypothetical protein n=1 Tax=Massilia sp. UYP11 TaxID=1756385 RepID=UPI003D262B2F